MNEKAVHPVVLLSGPVGAGKTTVAKELIKLAAHPTVYIEGDLFWSFIVRSDKSISRKKNFMTIMKSMIASTIPYALNGYEVLLDFSVPPWFLETALKIVEVKNIPLEYIVLLPDEKKCAARAAAREEGVISDYSVYHDFYMDFHEAGKYIISDDTSTAKKIAERINKFRSEGKFKVIIDS